MDGGGRPWGMGWGIPFRGVDAFQSPDLVTHLFFPPAFLANSAQIFFADFSFCKGMGCTHEGLKTGSRSCAKTVCVKATSQAPGGQLLIRRNHKLIPIESQTGAVIRHSHKSKTGRIKKPCCPSTFNEHLQLFLKINI